VAEVHLGLGPGQRILRLRLGDARRGGTAREQPRHEGHPSERSARGHGVGADAGVSAAVRGEGAPTWIWAPVAAPAMAPRNAMNEIPVLRRNACSAAPSGLSGCTATARA